MSQMTVIDKIRGGEVALNSCFYYESKQRNRNKLGDEIAW